ncbi:hypothetical protein [Streptomyces sp. NPDC019507]|uniref:hypothetical protein n=1 Tax=Streptomyces sp. NPDC019507 TaxID=3154689 RepID=UPI0033E68E60
MGQKGARFTMDVDGITTPYTSDPYGRDLRPTIPYVGQHRFVLERDRSDWRLVKDLTAQR